MRKIKIVFVVFAVITSISLLNIVFAQSGKPKSGSPQFDGPQRGGGQPGDLYGQMPPPPPPGGLSDPWILEQLNLNDAQKEQIKKIAEKARTDAQPYHEELRQIGDQLREVMESGSFDEAKVRPILARESELMLELKIIHLRSQSNIVGLLTPEQKAKLRELHEQRGPHPPRS